MSQRLTTKAKNVSTHFDIWLTYLGKLGRTAEDGDDAEDAVGPPEDRESAAAGD